MKELRLACSVILGGAAVYTTVTAVKYKYEVQSLPSSDFEPIERQRLQSDQQEEIPSEVIHNKNAFDIKRGVEDDVDQEDSDETPTVQGTYTFELRGIIGIGKKPVALFSAKLNGRSSSTRGRTPSRSTVSGSSNKIHTCKIGSTIAESEYKIVSIKNGQVIIKDNKDNAQVFTFSLTFYSLAN